MQYIVYKTTNRINGKIYIGVHQTNNIEDGYLGSGIAFKDALLKHGKENFSREILHIFDNKDDMYQKEFELVNEDFVCREDTYNLVVGGVNKSGKHHPMYGKNHTEESKHKMSINSSGEKSPWLGKKHSPETIEKMKKVQCGENNAMYGRVASLETRKKMSMAHKGKPKSEEHRRKLSEAAKLRWKRQNELKFKVV